MLKKLILENWKSFRYAELPIDPLTILIGANASGKSNAIEALALLNALAGGLSLEQSLQGEGTYKGIRGGLEGSQREASKPFCVRVRLSGSESKRDYLYTFKAQSYPEAFVDSESILVRDTRAEKKDERQIFSSSLHEHPLPNSPEKYGHGVRMLLIDADGKALVAQHPDVSALIPVASLRINEPVYQDVRAVISCLQQIKLLSPIPESMRNFSQFSKELNPDASNIAGYIAALSETEKQSVEGEITRYVGDLSGHDIKKVWAEPVGRSSRDAMLYGEEKWGNGESSIEIDARSMSDGTLRFIAILTALLTCKEGSQLIVEDIDDGFHPSRAQLLLRAIRDIGEKRNIDVLVTTHNPALLDSLEQDYLPFVVVAHRDLQTGESLLTPLDKIDNLPKLLASASLGDLVTQGAIERNLEAEAIAS